MTVKHRIREIGIRRSFGATAGRVFFSVMMESVVATVVAGVVGVMIAILVVQEPSCSSTYVLQGVEDVPPFPIEAALVGLVAATAVGALAGLLPALVAVRVKVDRRDPVLDPRSSSRRRAAASRARRTPRVP